MMRQLASAALALPPLAMTVRRCGLGLALLLVLGANPTSSKKSRRNKRVGHDPFLQSTAPQLFDQTKRLEPYASLDQRDAVTTQAPLLVSY